MSSTNILVGWADWAPLSLQGVFSSLWIICMVLLSKVFCLVDLLVHENHSTFSVITFQASPLFCGNGLHFLVLDAIHFNSSSYNTFFLFGLDPDYQAISPTLHDCFPSSPFTVPLIFGSSTNGIIRVVSISGSLTKVLNSREPRTPLGAEGGVRVGGRQG